MRITFINVGYGDAILFQGENGYTALLDGGGNLEEEFAGNCFRIRAVDYLQKQGITHLNDVIISHIHEDHVCGLEEILRLIPTDHLYVSYFLEPFSSARPLTPGPQAPRSVVLYTKALNAYCRILKQRMQSGQAIHVLKAGEQLPLTEGLTATILGPKPASIQHYLRRIEQVFKSESEEEVTRLLGEPVSYTHLDVYKRQGYLCAARVQAVFPQHIQQGSCHGLHSLIVVPNILECASHIK